MCEDHHGIVMSRKSPKEHFEEKYNTQPAVMNNNSWIGANFFTIHIANCWNGSLAKVAEAPTLEFSKE